VVYIAELPAERQAIGLKLARLAPAATLAAMATRRDPDIVALAAITTRAQLKHEGVTHAHE
jgi:hypothetical protein